jgi:hypothetical protein
MSPVLSSLLKQYYSILKFTQMKNILWTLVLLVSLFSMSSCEKDEGKNPNISFKGGASYTNTNATIAAGTSVLVGINASKAEDKDVLKKFNISKSVNGATAISVFDKDLSGSEGDDYSYDYTATAGTTAGDAIKYTFTVTNRDGLTNQVSLTVTAN